MSGKTTLSLLIIHYTSLCQVERTRFQVTEHFFCAVPKKEGCLRIAPTPHPATGSAGVAGRLGASGMKKEPISSILNLQSTVEVVSLSQ
jgi:hypothetical protein